MSWPFLNNAGLRNQEEDDQDSCISLIQLIYFNQCTYFLSVFFLSHQQLKLVQSIICG